MKKIWIHKARSFSDAVAFDVHYYAAMSSKERLETVQFLREYHFKMDRQLADESRKGLRRSLKIIKQK